MSQGKIISIRGNIVEVQFAKDSPKIRDVLFVSDNKETLLEVYSSSSANNFYCLLLTGNKNLKRGSIVENTNKPLMIPMGEKILGRVINIFGTALDGGEPIQSDQYKSIYADENNHRKIGSGTGEILETGIKAIDFFAPVLKGGKVGFLGGAGVGKTILLTEIIHNFVVLNKSSYVSVFSGIGERVREGHELFETLKESGVLPSVSLIFGEMSKNPAVRFRTAHAGASMVEYFRDVMDKNVLFFIDNVFRFAQAGNELSTMMNQIPSEGGYQATLGSEMSSFHERLFSTANSVTTFEAVYVPSDDLSDSGVQAIFPFLDSIIVLSRDVYQEGRFPAIDILSSRSSALDPQVIGEEHYETVIAAQQVLKKATSLDRIVSLVGEGELSASDREIYRRAQMIKNYMTQYFYVAKPQTGNDGVFVPRLDAVAYVKKIIDGGMDSVEPDTLLYIK